MRKTLTIIGLAVLSCLAVPLTATAGTVPSSPLAGPNGACNNYAGGGTKPVGTAQATATAIAPSPGWQTITATARVRLASNTTYSLALALQNGGSVTVGCYLSPWMTFRTDSHGNAVASTSVAAYTGTYGFQVVVSPTGALAGDYVSPPSSIRVP